MPSSAPECAAPPPPVELFVTPRTLRGTLGDAFVRSCVQLFERDHGPGSGCFTSTARTVELTVVGVSASGPVAVSAGIADPAFAGAEGGSRMPGSSSGQVEGQVGDQVDVDALDGIGALRGPAGVDLRRWASIRVLGPGGDSLPVDPARLRVRVIRL